MTQLTTVAGLDAADPKWEYWWHPHDPVPPAQRLHFASREEMHAAMGTASFHWEDLLWWVQERLGLLVVLIALGLLPVVLYCLYQFKANNRQWGMTVVVRLGVLILLLGFGLFHLTHEGASVVSVLVTLAVIGLYTVFSVIQCLIVRKRESSEPKAQEWSKGTEVGE